MGFGFIKYDWTILIKSLNCNSGAILVSPNDPKVASVTLCGRAFPLYAVSKRERTVNNIVSMSNDEEKGAFSFLDLQFPAVVFKIGYYGQPAGYVLSFRIYLLVSYLWKQTMPIKTLQNNRYLFLAFHFFKAFQMIN